MLNLLQLHKPDDNRDARAYILAKGKNLRFELDKLQLKLVNKLSKDELIWLVSENARVKLRIKLNNKTVREWLYQIKSLRIKQGISYSKMAEITGTSGEDWKRIEIGEHLPSCKKFRRILKSLNLKVEKVCKDNDFCLRSIDVIVNSFYSKWVPLVFISRILELYEIHFGKVVRKNFLKYINRLKMNHDNSNSIKASKEMTKTLAKILGAFAADGNFYPPDMIRWEDEYKEQLEVLSKWFRKVFGIKLKIEHSKRERNSFTTRFRNKIIGRYLEIFFGFKPGNKTHTVDEPKLIKNQDFNIRKAFASGALMFDGSVNSDGTVSFGSVSKKFRDSIAQILLEDGLNLSISEKPNISKKFDNKGIWTLVSSRKLDLKQLKKLSFYFEKDTLKLTIIDFYLGKVEIPNTDYLKSLFPKIRTAIKPTDLIKTISDMRTFDVYQLIQNTNLSRLLLLRYLRILETAKIIKSEMNGRKRIYSLNNSLTNLPLSNSIKSE